MPSGGTESSHMHTESLRSHGIRMLLGWAAAIPVFVSVSGQPAEKADYILLNGKIFTASVAQPYVNALATRGERIIALGTAEQMTAFASATTTRLDLHGRVVVPGLNDAHYHFSPTPAEYRLEF